MANPQSSSSTSQISINLPTTMTQIDYSSLVKTLNSNIPMKLDKTNYIYWKTQVMPAIRALDLKDYISSSSVVPEAYYIEVHTHLQNIKKGLDSIFDFVLKIKNISDSLMTAGEEVIEPCNVIGALLNNFRDLHVQILKIPIASNYIQGPVQRSNIISKHQLTMPLLIQ
ncbi:hypothetical protein ACOSQ3_009477 [Xanthoceras sorbifolium]